MSDPKLQEKIIDALKTVQDPDLNKDIVSLGFVKNLSIEGGSVKFDVELTSVGDKKINVIKVIREITSLGLKEAKDMADSAPSVIKEAAPKEEAEEVKKKLEEAGGTVTLK